MFKDLSGGMRVAVLLVLITFVYLFCVTFITMPPSGEEHSKTIVGFMLGTVVATILNYYYGNSSKRETPRTDDAAKQAAAELEEKRIEAAKEDVEKEEEARIETAEETAEIVIQDATIKAQRGGESNVPDKEISK